MIGLLTMKQGVKISEVQISYDSNALSLKLLRLEKALFIEA